MRKAGSGVQVARVESYGMQEPNVPGAFTQELRRREFWCVFVPLVAHCRTVWSRIAGAWPLNSDDSAPLLA